jgi:tetratricopeptide (TPR) repeat protein
LLIDFEVAPLKGSVSFLQRNSTPSQPARTAADWFDQGRALEGHDKVSAEQAYREAIRADPRLTSAYLNLGALLCDDGRSDQAKALLDEAIGQCAPSAPLHFNRAIALEDLGRVAEALQSYESCLEIAPDLADAHFNAARLHLQLGHQQSAVKHFSAYRRLEPI